MRSEVDIPTLLALQAEWLRSPPAHHLIAAYLEYRPPRAQTDVPAQEPDLADLTADLGALPFRQVAPLDTSAFDSITQQEPTHGQLRQDS